MISLTVRLVLRALAMTPLLLGTLVVAPPGRAFAQTALPTQPLTLLVRDGSGQPLPGVALRLLLEGPPHEPYDNCVTDEAGTCTLLVPPGDYLVQFDRGYRGRIFLPPEAQNAGALDDGQSGGGFGIHFAPSNEAQRVAFVVGLQGEDTLAPLWDLSSGPDEPPQPFFSSSSPAQSPTAALAAAGIRLEPLVEPETTATVSTLTLPVGEPSPTPQALVTGIDVGRAETAKPTAVATNSDPPASELAPTGPVRRTPVIGLAALLLFALLLFAARWLLRRHRLKGETSNG